MNVATASPETRPQSVDTMNKATALEDVATSEAITSLEATTEAGIDDCMIKSIAPEIRNRIYELVLAPEHEADDRVVDLLKPNPPSKDFLMTCRQFYEEAKLMHRDAYRKYWSETEFDISLSEYKRTYGMSKADVRARMEAMDEQAISCVKDIRLVGTYILIDSQRSGRHRVERDRGIWFPSYGGKRTRDEGFLMIPSENTDLRLLEKGFVYIVPNSAPIGFALPKPRSIVFSRTDQGELDTEEAMRIMEQCPMTKTELFWVFDHLVE